MHKFVKSGRMKDKIQNLPSISTVDVPYAQWTEKLSQLVPGGNFIARLCYIIFFSKYYFHVQPLSLKYQEDKRSRQQEHSKT